MPWRGGSRFIMIYIQLNPCFEGIHWMQTSLAGILWRPSWGQAELLEIASCVRRWLSASMQIFQLISASGTYSKRVVLTRLMIAIKIAWTFYAYAGLTQWWHLYRPFCSMHAKTWQWHVHNYWSQIAHCSLRLQDMIARSRITSDADKVLCGVGREKLFSVQRKFTLRWLSDSTIPSAGCATTNSCEEGREAIESGTRDAIPKIRVLDRWHDSWSGILCVKCERRAQRSLLAAREDAWKMVPECFDFVDWESVRVAQNFEDAGWNVDR